MSTLAAPARRPLPWRLDCHLPADAREAMAAEVRRGLGDRPRWLLPKWFYDARGCALFEAITELPEYYQTRTELGILRARAAGVVARHRPTELVELGSGSSRKTRALLDAMAAADGVRRYVPFDVSPGAILDAAGPLAEAYPGMRVHGVAGDFERHLRHVPRRPRGGRRLVAFLGGTIGNIHPVNRAPFLHAVGGLLRPGDRLLMGTDLVGDRARLEAAYDDAAGVTAEFNRNIVRVLNDALGGDADPHAFAHVARFDEDRAWIEMRLRATRDVAWRLDALGVVEHIAAGEEIRTEISCKFTRASAEAMYAEAGLRLLEWHTDAEGRFAVSVAAPHGDAR